MIHEGYVQNELEFQHYTKTFIWEMQEHYWPLCVATLERYSSNWQCEVLHSSQQIIILKFE